MKFVFFVTEGPYAKLGEVLLDSLEAFSQAPVKVVAVNCEFEHGYKRLEVEKVQWPPLSPAPFSVARLEHLLANSEFKGSVLIDADCIAKPGVDKIMAKAFDLNKVAQCVAPCGSWDRRLFEGQKPKTPYVNMVPLLLNSATWNWLKRAESLNEITKNYYAQRTNGGHIDDESLLNLLRFFYRETETLMPLLGQSLDDNDTAFLHGEKNPEKARANLQALLDKRNLKA